MKRPRILPIRLRLPKGYVRHRMPVDDGFGLVQEEIKGENDPENPENKET